MSLLTEEADMVTHRKWETSSFPKCPQQFLDALVVYRPALIPEKGISASFL